MSVLLLVAAAAVPLWVAAASDNPAPGGGSDVQLVQAPDPLDDPEAVEDRVETGNPEDTVLYRGNERILIGLVLLVGLTVLGVVIWKTRRGPRRERSR